MAGFGVLITSVTFMHLVTGNTLQLVALVGLAICTHVSGKHLGEFDIDTKF